MLALLCRFLNKSGPELAQISREHHGNFYSRAAINILRQHVEHGQRSLLYFVFRRTRQLLRDVRKERFFMALFGRLVCRVPAFIVEPAQQHRQLCAEMRRALWTDTITKSV